MYDNLTFDEVIKNIGTYQDKFFHRDLNDPNADNMAFSLAFGPLLACQLSNKQALTVSTPMNAADMNIAEVLALFRGCYQVARMSMTIPNVKEYKDLYYHQIRDIDAFLKPKSELYFAQNARKAKAVCNEYMKWSHLHNPIPTENVKGTFRTEESVVTSVAPIVPYGGMTRRPDYEAKGHIADGAHDDGMEDFSDVVDKKATLNDVLEEYLRLGPWIFHVICQTDLCLDVNYKHPDCFLRHYYGAVDFLKEHPNDENARRTRDVCKAILTAFSLYFGSTSSSLEALNFFYDLDWMNNSFEDIMTACEGMAEGQPIDMDTIHTQVKDMNAAYHKAMVEVGGDLHEEVDPHQLDQIRDFVRSTREFRPNRQISSLFMSTNQEDIVIIAELEDAPIAMCKKTKQIVIPVNDILEDYRPLLVVMDVDGKIHVENTLNVTNL